MGICAICGWAGQCNDVCSNPRPFRHGLGTHSAGSAMASREGIEGEGGPGLDEEEGNDIGTRVETFLGEFRMVIPALAAILGFQLMVAFQASFQDLGQLEQVATFLALSCTTVAFLLLLMPASYHRFTWEFEETEEFLRFSRRSIGAAFVFLPFVLALTLYVQAVQAFGSRPWGASLGAGVLALAIGFWWVLPMHRAHRKGYLPHDAAHREKERKGEEARRGRRPQRPSSSSRSPRREEQPPGPR